MTPDTDTKRIQVVHRLHESGFTPKTIDQVLAMIDAMMTGQVALANVLVAATEVCKVCELGKTQQHVNSALACLAGEMLEYRDPSSGVRSGELSPLRLGIACWNPVKQGQA